jgi:hypothetical protein
MNRTRHLSIFTPLAQSPQKKLSRFFLAAAGQLPAFGFPASRAHVKLSNFDLCALPFESFLDSLGLWCMHVTKAGDKTAPGFI